MKTTYVIALIAAISAVSIGTIALNGFTVPLAIASVSPESGTMMGHVEYVLRDADGNIKTYVQSDNSVVDMGDNCVMSYAFNPSEADSDFCDATTNGFRFIGIGNATATTTSEARTLTNQATTVAVSGTPGLMAMRTDSALVFTNSTDGGTVVIATEAPFTFSTSGSTTNATTVTSAGLFDATCTETAGICTAYASPQNMFSVQTISVVVSNGDSLSVTWTITVGTNA